MLKNLVKKIGSAKNVFDSMRSFVRKLLTVGSSEVFFFLLWGQKPPADPTTLRSRGGSSSSFQTSGGQGSIRREEEEGGGAGAVAKTVDYESHQVINDFINKTNRAAVTAVTRAEG